MKTTWITILTAALLASVLPAQAQEQLISLSFEDAPLEQAVELYREWTGRTIIKQADLSARITLKGRQLTQNEAKQAIETVLSMNGVALVPMGDKFLKVVPIANARQEGMEIKPFDADKKYTEADVLITQVIPLRFVVFADVQPLIQHLVHGYGKIIPMDRINSVLVTDTSANIARIVELVSMVDQPAEKIEPRIYQLKYAEATTIAGKLKELVEAAKTKKGEQTVVGNVRTLPGVIRAPKADVVEAEGAAEQQTEMIQGEVKVVSDDRTNILIIFSKAANFGFFDNIIKVLDVPVDPAVIVEVINLEFAKAKEISGILNEFVGAAKASEKTKAPGAGKVEGSKTVDEIIQRAVEPTGKEISPAAKSAIGRLSADTKILSDERSNSLLLMGRKSDIEAIKQVITSLDVMLEQVMIEAVILSVGLGDDLSTGIKWVYDTQKGTEKIGTKTTTTTNGTSVSSITEDILKVSPIRQLGGLNGGSLGSSNDAVGALGGGLSYYGIFPNINMKALINATKSDSNARILSTPVVLTTDNTEAKITVGEERPVISSSINSGTGTINNGYSARSTYQYRNIGMTLTVTPNINPQGFVVMEITQTADDVGGEVTIDGNKVPIVSKREITATVAVQDRSTVVLGGLIRKSDSKSASKIPILGDIPVLGWLFSTRNNSASRSELVVLLTPYVLTTPEQAQKEAKRVYEASDSKKTEWPRGWSQSPLRNDEPEKKVEKKKDRKNKKTDEEETSTDLVPTNAVPVQ
ncbi:MAG: type II secretion system secretin GspD [Verrucomicrobia bacterium]|nr:type II secretion system secretin GspD [Verrucomicrobiota bacterium]